MAESGVLQQDVKDFVRDWILTPTHLDTLVALHKEPDRAFTVDELVATQSAAAPAVEVALSHFEAGHFVSRSHDGETRYRYAPRLDLRASVDRVVDAYNRIPVQLLRAVYNRPATSLRSFSDAFRIQKPK